MLILCALLLLYIVFVPMLKSSLEKEARTPHDTFKNLDVTTTVHYQKIAITIDFGRMDQITINGALKQGGEGAKGMMSKQWAAIQELMKVKDEEDGM